MRAQIAVEYVMIVALAFVVAVGYLLVISNVQKRTIDDAEQSETERIAGMIQGEIILAAQVKDGYERTFDLPDKIRDQDYIILSSNDSVRVVFKTRIAHRLTPLHNGTISPGENTITKKDGIITIK